MTGRASETTQSQKEQRARDINERFSAKLGTPSLNHAASNEDFILQKHASLCNYPFTERGCEPATSINAFYRWNSATDFAIKHCNAAQLFQQQLLRNPLCMHQQPERVFASLTTAVQMDARFFIGHTNMFTGEYEAQKHSSAGSEPRVSKLTATVSLQSIAVVTKSDLDGRVKEVNELLALDMAPEHRVELLYRAWEGCE
jgi:hypothetical protein